MFGRQGDGKGNLNYSYGTFINSNDRVYVSDYNHHVSVFTSGGLGAFIASFGRKGNGLGEFNQCWCSCYFTASGTSE